MTQTTHLPPDLINALNAAGLETRVDSVSRLLYSTDASIYQIEPLGVALPRTADHINAAVELCAQYQVPIIARGSGSGLAGQAIGRGLILDCSRHLDALITINPEERTATAQPGLVLDVLNAAAAAHGLQFGPDPASSERATLGGVIANNATGAHSILYGMAADHLLEVETVFTDGYTASLGEIDLAQPIRSVSRAAAFTRAALGIHHQGGAAIRANWPQVWRRASGYNLNYLLPWSPTAPPQWHPNWLPHHFGATTPEAAPYPPVRPGRLNLAALLAGSEGTLGIIRSAKINLVRKPRHTILGVLAYETIAAACDDTPRLLEFGPSAVELMTRRIVQMARSVPAYARLIDFVPHSMPDDEIPAAFLVVEFSGDSPAALREQVRILGPQAHIAADPAAQARIWKARKVGLGLLLSKPGNAQPSAFIEDVVVPVEQLGAYVQEVEKICAQNEVEAAYYAHASAGCLHIRPVLDLRTDRHIAAMRQIAAHTIGYSLQKGGVISGEHGDGLARSIWLEQAFGAEVMALHGDLKRAADPDGLLNPGKIIDPAPMDANLRYGAGYASQGWPTTLDFSARQVSLENAIEMCNGAGVCRKLTGFMCPSFQVTRDEQHSTRGRSNLLRAYIRQQGGEPQIGAEAVMAALDLCLACKGCKTECPSGVDVAKLKYEFLQEYYRSHPRRVRDYLFGYFGELARFSKPLHGVVNGVLGNPRLWKLTAKLLNLAPKRSFPKFRPQNLTPARPKKSQAACLLLFDDFTRYNHPEAGQAALKVLAAAGIAVQILPVGSAGRSLISKGFLEQAKKQARKLVQAVEQADPIGRLPIIGLEPSEIYTLADEFVDFFPQDQAVAALARRAWMWDEYLLRHEDALAFVSNPSQPDPRPKVLLHGHCYQKARPPADDGLPVGMDATVQMLETMGYAVETIQAGCCGMAGSFGYEAEHYDIAMQVGELALFPAIRQAGSDVLVAASGVSCQAQIADGTQRTAAHPISLVAAQISSKL